MRFDVNSMLDPRGARGSVRAPLAAFSPRRAALAAAAAGTILALAGCGRFGGSSTDGLVARDVLDIKHQLEERNKNAEAEQRKTEFRLQSLEEKIQTRTEILQNNLDESLRTQREQSETLKKVGQQVEDLSYQVARMGSGLGASSAAAQSAQPQRPAAQGTPAITPTAGATPAAAAADATEEVYNEGLKQYNLGKYAEAAAAFDKALAAGASGERGAQVNYWLAESAFRLDELDRAERSFRSMIEAAKTLDPASPVHAFSWRGVERLAQIRQRQGDSAKALYYYKYILQTNPGYEGADRVKAQVESLESGAPAAVPAPAQPAEGAAPAAGQSVGGN